MIIIIDGYNVLKQMLPDEYIEDSLREKFIEKLVCYSRKRRHQIVLVFDAGPFRRNSKETRGLVQIIYSGLDESADDYIVRHVEKHRSYDMLLVSSDRNLQKSVVRYGVDSIKPEEFYFLLKNNKNKKEVKKPKEKALLIKTAQDSSLEVDDLMAELENFQVFPKDVDLFTLSLTSNSQKKTKKERKLVEKLRKL